MCGSLFLSRGYVYWFLLIFVATDVYALFQKSFKKLQHACSKRERGGGVLNNVKKNRTRGSGVQEGSSFSTSASSFSLNASTSVSTGSTHASAISTSTMLIQWPRGLPTWVAGGRLWHQRAPLAPGARPSRVTERSWRAIMAPRCSRGKAHRSTVVRSWEPLMGGPELGD